MTHDVRLFLAGFADCDLLTTNLLTGSDQDFGKALRAWETSEEGEPVNILGQSAVHLAVLSSSRLERLLQSGMNPDTVDRGGTTPMMYAAAYGRLDSVIVLMQHVAHLDFRDRLNNRFFESYAICFRHVHVVKGLVKWLRDEGGAATALNILDRCIHYHVVNASATMDMDVPILEALLELGADPDITYSAKNTPMHLVEEAEHGKVLLKHGFTAAAVQNKNGETALMHIVRFVDPALTKSLLNLQLSAGVSINLRDASHWTLLLHLIKHLRYRHSGSWDAIDERFRRKTNATRCLNLLLCQGAEVLLTDACECPCSPGGCSAMSIALHHALEVTRITSYNEVLEALPVSLTIAVLSYGDETLRTLADTIAMFSAFIESGRRHSCCALSTVRPWYFPFTADSTQATDNRSATTACHGSCNIDNNTTDERARLVNQLARFYALLERRSQARYENEMAAEIKAVLVCGPKRPKNSVNIGSSRCIWVDHRVEPAQRLDLQEYRDWISDCVEKRLQLYTGTSTNAWAGNALGFVDALDREMGRLKVGAT